MEQISSHWQTMLHGFDGKPKSLRGVSELHHPLSNPVHRLLQRRYVAMARDLHALDRFIGAGRRVASRQKRAFNLDMLRQSMTLAFCEDFGAIKDRANYVVIGDGYAALGSIILEALPDSRVTFINIEPVLTIDRKFFALAHPKSKAATFLDAEQLDLMPQHFTSFDLACMGEINPNVRDTYCKLRAERGSFIYSANRVSKTFPDGTTTRFADYAWPSSVRVIVDEPCPWHQSFYTWRPPFFRRFDGQIDHKLIKSV